MSSDASKDKLHKKSNRISKSGDKYEYCEGSSATQNFENAVKSLFKAGKAKNDGGKPQNA